MANIKMLEDKMKEKNISIAEMSRQLDIDESTWYRKRKNFQSFSIGEAEKICQILELSSEETTSIFFAS